MFHTDSLFGRGVRIFIQYADSLYTAVFGNLSVNDPAEAAIRPIVRAQTRLPDNSAVHHVHNSERTQTQRELHRESIINTSLSPDPSQNSASFPVNEWSAPNSFSLSITFPLSENLNVPIARTSRFLPRTFESSFPPLDGTDIPVERFCSLANRVATLTSQSQLPAVGVIINNGDYVESNHPLAAEPIPLSHVDAPAAPPTAAGLSARELESARINQVASVSVLESHKSPALEFTESKRSGPAEPVESKNTPSRVVVSSPLDEFAQSNSWFADLLIHIKCFIDDLADSILNGDD